MQELIPLKNRKMLTIREAAPEDAAQMLALSKIVGAETDYLLTDENGWRGSEADEKELLACWMTDPMVCMFVALIDGEIVGFFSVMHAGTGRSAHVAEFGVAIRKSCWHLGIGAMAMVLSIDFAREAGYHKLVLCARADNERAIALYRRFGFEQTGVRRDQLFIRGEYFDEIMMELML